MTDTRPRGVLLYRMPDEVCGPDLYAFATRADGTGRMVHTQGVAYLVTEDKPWCWTDYDPTQRSYTLAELVALTAGAPTVDLADWVDSFGARLEDNFGQLYHWCTS